MARIGFALSKVRSRFGAASVIGLNGLNVPATVQFLSSSKEVLRKGIPAKVRKERICIGPSQSATGQYAKAVKREKAITGQKFSSTRTSFQKYKKLMSHSPELLECKTHGPGPASCLLND